MAFSNHILILWELFHDIIHLLSGLHHANLIINQLILNSDIGVIVAEPHHLLIMWCYFFFVFLLFFIWKLLFYSTYSSRERASKTKETTWQYTISTLTLLWISFWVKTFWKYYKCWNLREFFGNLVICSQISCSSETSLWIQTPFHLYMHICIWIVRIAL